MTKLLLGILSVIIVSVLLISFILRPYPAGLQYWGSIGWFIILIILNWYTSAAIFSSGARQKSGQPGNVHGVLPTLSIATFIYSALSISFLIFYYNGFISQTTHLVLQIGSGAIILVFGLMTFVAAKAAEQGTSAAISRAEILDELRRLKRMKVGQVDQKDLDDIITYVAHRMPHPSKLNQDKLSLAWSGLTKNGSTYPERLKAFKSYIFEA